MEGVRRALQELGHDASPRAILKYVKKEFGIRMSLNTISNYKSTLKSAGESAVVRQPGSTAGVRTSGGFSAEEIKAVKELSDRIGGDKVRQLVGVLAK